MKKIVQLLILMGISSIAMADGNVMPMKVPAKVQAECTSCHMVYPPAFLPKESWGRIMQGLDKHYGTDASLDAQSVKEISQWLNQHAGTYKRVSAPPPQDRITESACGVCVTGVAGIKDSVFTESIALLFLCSL